MKSALHARKPKEGDQNAGRTVGDRRLETARAVGQLVHSHLVEMRPVANAQAEFELEADLRGGERLSEICRSKFGSGPVPLSFGLRILLDALSGLAVLHGTYGFAHGEAAPCSIVVGRDGTSRLVPVVASHFREGVPPGDEAAGYAAPERLRGDAFDHRADVFSAGVMLWEMITGRSFRGLPAETIAAWVVDGKVPDPVHPDDAPWVRLLAQVATRALAVKPGDRWPHVGVLGDEIETAAKGHIASAREVAGLVADESGVRASPPAHHPGTSLSPTSVSIPPVSIPGPPRTPSLGAPSLGVQPPGVPPPLAPSLVPRPSREAPSPARPTERNSRRQAVIAWSALLAAVVLVGVAAHELLDTSGTSKPAQAAAPTASFAVRLPSPASPPSSASSSPDALPRRPGTAASSTVTAPTGPTAPVVANGPPPANARPVRPPGRQAPARRPKPAAAASAPAPRATPKKSDDAFGI